MRQPRAAAEGKEKPVPDINVALVGHRFMGKAHTHAYRDVNLFYPDVPYRPRLKVIAGRDAAAVQEAADRP